MPPVQSTKVQDTTGVRHPGAMPRPRSTSAMTEDHLYDLLAGMGPTAQRAFLSSLAGPGEGFGVEHPDAREALLPRRAEVATFRVRVDLDGVRPPVWRRLEVASDTALSTLHEVLQAAMGWDDRHLHRFAIGGPVFGRGAVDLLSAADLAQGDVGTPEADVRLDEVLAQVGDRLAYTYDFGDGWEHTITLEAVLPRAGDASGSRCTGGRRACPPEDVGGVPGYAALLELLAHPGAARRHPDAADVLEWLGATYGSEGFDPAAFDVEQADAAVRTVFHGVEPDPALLPPAVADLLARAQGPGRSTLVRLVAAAGLEVAQADPTADGTAMLAAAHRRLLDVVGADGVRLTAAGYLPPAVVRGLVDVVDPNRDWLTTSDREVDYYPVLLFRLAAQRLRLVRTLKGRLVLTPAGRRVRGDDVALVAYLAAALPAGEGAQRAAGLLVLLTVAAGEAVERPYPDLGPGTEGAPVALSSAMGAIGWSMADGSWPSERDVRHAAEGTIELLRTVGALPPRGTRGPDAPTSAGRWFARAALRG